MAPYRRLKSMYTIMGTALTDSVCVTYDKLNAYGSLVRLWCIFPSLSSQKKTNSAKFSILVFHSLSGSAIKASRAQSV